MGVLLEPMSDVTKAQIPSSEKCRLTILVDLMDLRA